MGSVRTIQRSFGGGEVSPELWGRSDDSSYASGLATCRNFVTKVQGPAENRAGFEFVCEVKDSTKAVRLIPFTYSSTQTMVIEIGAGYFRFHTQGATLMDGDVPYEIANAFAESDLFDIHYVQSSDVMTLVHPLHPPAELRRLGALNWQLISVSFGTSLVPPGNVILTPVGVPTGVGLYLYRYVITTESLDRLNESRPSGEIACANNLGYTGSRNELVWSFVAPNIYYNIYKEMGGLYGFIGQTAELAFIDANISPDLSKTPPLRDYALTTVNNYPAAVSYFEQRRCFAGTLNKPQNLWMTQSGTESGMSYSLPTRNDDRISVRVAAREANIIRHIVPLSQLLLLTSAAEWRVGSVNSDAITPASINVSPQSYVGASNVQPCIVNNSLVYAVARGGHMRELAYSWQSSGFTGGDLSLRAGHLFDGLNIIDMAYAKAPIPLVWCVSSGGNLLGLTYVPEQQVGAWHRHDTDGAFESVAVVAEGLEDVLYAVVARTINGTAVRYIERMASRRFATPADAFFVDCGLTYRGAPAVRISGLDYIEGKTVNILTDGAPHPQRVVNGGAVTLDYPAAVVTVGLPIVADLQTLPMAVQVDSALGQGRAKSVNRVWLRVWRSSGIWVGPDADHLVESKQRTTEPFGSPPALKSAEVEVVLSATWAQDGQIFIRQRDPLPLTVASLAAEVALGG